MRKFFISLLLASTPTLVFSSFESLLEPVKQELSLAETQSSPVQNNQTNKNTTQQATPFVPNYDKQEDFLITRSMLSNLLRDALIDKFFPEGTLKIELSRPWNDLLVNPNNWTLQVIEYPAEGLQKNINLRFRIFSDAKPLGEWYVGIHCALWQEGLLLKTKLNKGQALEESFFQKTPVNVLSNNNLYVPSSIQIEDYEVTRSLNHTSILEWNDIRVKPIVRKGQIIDVIVDDGLMSIRTRGTAMENGSIDEMIFVRNLASSKKIQAKVINDNTVQVFF